MKRIGRRGGTMLLMTISAIGCFGIALFTYLESTEELADGDHSSYYILKKVSAFVAKCLGNPRRPLGLPCDGWLVQYWCG